MTIRIWLISFLFVSGPVAAQESFMVKDVRVFDGTRVVSRASVLVERGVIRAVQPDLPVGRGVAVVDGAGKTLMPGLLDAHAHVHALRDLSQALAFGVTTELDMFGSPDMIRALKTQDREGKMRADARFAGIAATAPGGHGTEYDFPIPTIRGPQEAQAFVDARLAEGSDYIKIIQNAGGPVGGQAPTISRETMAALIDAAHRRGKLAVVHITFESAAREALDAGADGLAHLFVGPSAQPGLGSLATQHHAFVVPTLSVLTNVCGASSGAALAADPRISPYLLPLSAATLSQSVRLRPGRQQPSCEGVRQAIRQLLEVDAPILAGTDVGNAGIVHGASVHGEMALLAANGLTPVQVLTSATSSVSDAFRLRDRGRIAPGQRADLVLVNGDPTSEISATRDIVAIWKQGYRFDRDAFRASVSAFDVPAVPVGSETGLVSDFEGRAITTRFGTTWRAFDGIQMNLAPGGAHGSRTSLLVSGTVASDRQSSLWPGIVFVPSGLTRAPANLSGKHGISFWAKGDGGLHRVGMVSETGRQEFPFRPGAEWQRFQFELPALPAFDARQFLFLIFAASAQPGQFEFQIDDVAFY